MECKHCGRPIVARRRLDTEKRDWMTVWFHARPHRQRCEITRAPVAEPILVGAARSDAGHG